MNKGLFCSVLLIILSPIFSQAATSPIAAPCTDCIHAELIYDGGQTSIWSSRQLDGNGLQSKIWAGYQLGSASQYYESGDGWGDPRPASTTGLEGTLWVEVFETYDANSSVLSVNVYSENASGYYDKRELFFTPQALLSGQGKAYYSGSDDGSGWSTGNMDVIGDFTCVECGYDLELNLVSMLFAETVAGQYQFSVNEVDSRELIYQENILYYELSESTYTLAEVPLPGALGLYLIALIMLPFSSHFKRKS